jgi:Na+/H+ antiporter NhaD/arsenite permease-like protein
MELKWIVLAITAVMYIAVIIFPARKAWIALVAAVLVIITGAVSPAHAFGVLVNWDVLMINIGCLILADLFIYSRVPTRIADNIVDASPNTSIAIVILLIITGLISAFVENVATVLVMAPIALSLCNKLKMNPTRFMIGLAVMANLQGTATLVGDPPSMIFASFTGYGFNDFFFAQGRPSIFFAVQIGMLIGAIYFYVYFSKDKKTKIMIEREPVLSWTPTVLLILMVGSLAACSFIFGGLSAASGLSVLGLGIIGLLWYIVIRKEGIKGGIKLVKKLDWETILFLLGIFIVIGAVGETGILEEFAHVLNHLIGGNVLFGFVAILLVSVILSGFIDNVPYIIAMLPVTATLSEAMGLKPELYMFALLIGSCLGGNLTPFGASANIMSVGILKKEGVALDFIAWLKIAGPFTVLTTLGSALFLWLVWR